MDRRGFLATGLLAGGALAAPGWAATGARFLSAANTAENETYLLGLSARGEVCFSLPIPSRGHAAAAHPRLPEAVAFARRPGRFAIVIDCLSGREVAQLNSPDGRHFYGHGAFTADGKYLLTTENDYDAPDGRLGVWDVDAGYVRVDDLPSGGIGPHEILRLRDGFAVANGGIQTHPDFERAKLNLPTMRTNLTFLTPTGQMQAQIWGELPQNSIRHIAAHPAGGVVAALQWQGNPMRPVPLAARITPTGMTYWSHPETNKLKHYAGSIAASPDGRAVAVTGPKGGHVIRFEGDGVPLAGIALDEASGVVAQAQGFTLTCRGGMIQIGPDGQVHRVPVAGEWRFDNHLVAL